MGVGRGLSHDGDTKGVSSCAPISGVLLYLETTMHKHATYAKRRKSSRSQVAAP